MTTIEDHADLSAVKAASVALRTRILFVSGEPDTPGNRYRIEDLAVALPADQYEVVTVRQDEISSRSSQLGGFQVAWFWRCRLTPAVANLLKRLADQGVGIVADIDDLVFASSSVTVDNIDGFRAMGWDPASAAPLFASRSAVLAAAHLRAATTQPLVEALEFDIGPTVAIPNGFDENAWNISSLARRLRPRSGLFRIGYAGGTLTHQRDLLVAARAVAQVLSENADARLVLFEGCVNLLEFPELMAHVNQIEWRDRVPISAMPFEYARFDVSIAPLEANNPFCEAKSALKFFEAALVNVVSIASPTPPFRQLIRDGKNGVLAESQDQWYRAITDLYSDAGRRRELAAQARQDVIWNCGPLRQGRMVSEVVDAVVGGMEHKVEPEKSWPLCFYPKVSTDIINVIEDHARPVISCGSVAVRVKLSTTGAVGILESIADRGRSDLDLIVVAEGADLAAVSEISDWLQLNSGRFARVRLGTVHGDHSESAVVNGIFALAMNLYLAWIEPEAGPVCYQEISQAIDEARSKKAPQVLIAPGGQPRPSSRVYSVEAWAAVGGVGESGVAIAEALDSFGARGRKVL